MNWDLSDLFDSIEDERIQIVLEEVKNKAQDFRKLQQGNIAKHLQSNQAIEMFATYEHIMGQATLLEVYAYLQFSQDTQAHERGAFLQKIQSHTADINENLIFFEVELSEISNEELTLLINNKQLENYKHHFERVLTWKQYQLSEKEEKVLNRKHLTGSRAFERLYSQELSEQKFDLREDGKRKRLTQAEILGLLYTEKDQQKRKIIAKTFTKKLKEKKKLLAFIYNTLIADKLADDTLRGFDFPQQSRHLSNEISSDAAETMVKVVEQNYSIVQEYYDFKRKVLGVEKLYDFDRYAPLPTHDHKFTFEQAREIVLEAFEKFSPEFSQLAKEFFEKSWIDADLTEGKQSGAYCMYVNPSLHPYVFMNFNGSANDVLTLAHELGHALHGQLARSQTMLNYSWPLTVSETASIFAETITFLSLVEKLDDNEKLGFYMHKIEGIFASVFRQVSMYRFEGYVHQEFRKKGELSVQSFDKLWKKSQKPMFGKSLTLTKDYESWWAYIPHFIQSPFYVYAYAFGELLTMSLVHQWQQGNGEFVRKYTALLASGGSKSPKELLEPFSINLEDKEFWQGGIDLIHLYIEKAKELYGRSLS